MHGTLAAVSDSSNRYYGASLHHLPRPPCPESLQPRRLEGKGKRRTTCLVLCVWDYDDYNSSLALHPKLPLRYARKETTEPPLKTAARCLCLA